MTSEKENNHFLFDCNIWMLILLKNQKHLFHFLQSKHYEIIITSYGMVEILRVLKRIALRQNITYELLEEKIWEFMKFPCIQMQFDKPISEKLIDELHRIPEYHIMTQIFQLELKDIPYLVASFQYNAQLITEDKRSILDKAATIQEKLGITILSWEHFLKKLQDHGYRIEKYD